MGVGVGTTAGVGGKILIDKATATLHQSTSDKIAEIVARTRSILHYSRVDMQGHLKDSASYHQQVDSLVIDLQKFDAGGVHEAYKQPREERMMQALIPQLKYAVENGAGYFIKAVAQHYPRLLIDSFSRIKDENEDKFKLLSAADRFYATAKGATADSEYPDAQRLMTALNAIPKPTPGHGWRER